MPFPISTSRPERSSRTWTPGELAGDLVDASAALAALLNAGPAREAIAPEQVHAPHLVDVEVANGLRRRVAAGQAPEHRARAGLWTWQRLGVTRYPMVGILGRIWELRENLSADDASYVALAESLACALVTADTRLGRAPGARCVITVVPR